jgi:hypothetical protein
VKRVLLLAFALCGASGAHAADPLADDETRAAYCVGVAQVRVLAYEHMTVVPCGPDAAQCTLVRQRAAAALARLRRELQAANGALAAFGLLDDGRRPESHRPESHRADVWQQVGVAIANGEQEALRCLNMRLPGFADPGAGDIGQSCRRIAVCVVEPSS